MNEVRTCPKCGGRMAKGSAEIFGNIFGCTREPKNQGHLYGTCAREGFQKMIF